MLHIFRCAGVNHVEVTNEEPYFLPGSRPLCDECYWIAKDGSE